MTQGLTLVTGGTGRIGNVLLKELCKKGVPTRVLVRSTSDQSALKGCVYEQVVGDILDPESITKACEGVEYVYHLAGKINISTHGGQETFDTNMTGTQNVIQACLKAHIKRLLYISTIHVFSQSDDSKPITESVPFCQSTDRNLYDCSKASATQEVLSAVREQNLDAVIVAPTGVTGPYDYRPSYFGKSLISFVKSGMNYSVDGAYDYVDVRDVVNGMITAMEKGQKGEMYILSGERLTMRDFVSYIKEFTNQTSQTTFLPHPIALALAHFQSFFNAESELTPYSLKTLLSNSNISHEKATKELGYVPRTVKESLKDQYEWFKKEGML